MNRLRASLCGAVALLFLVAPVFSAPPTALPKNDAPKFEILEARYGAGGQTKDVKSMLLPLCHEHFILIDVNNLTMGGDPAPDKPKELVVRMRTGKTELEQRFKEYSEVLILIPSDPDFIKSFADQAKDKLVILEAKKVRQQTSQDWLDDAALPLMDTSSKQIAPLA